MINGSSLGETLVVKQILSFYTINILMLNFDADIPALKDLEGKSQNQR